MKYESEKMILPSFPITAHLPYKPNTDPTDTITTSAEAGVVFTSNVSIEEKIDGASLGIKWHDGHPLIRNRDHILRKGYTKATAAKQQFASVWTWFYENEEKFKALSEMGPYCVYGEWCVAQHGIHYTKLPDWFIAYDVYNHEKDFFVSPPTARQWLTELGFNLPTLYSSGPYHGGYEELEQFANSISTFAESKAEGIYLKVYDDERITHRFKMVREDFVRGAFWNPKVLNKNTRVKA